MPHFSQTSQTHVPATKQIKQGNHPYEFHYHAEKIIETTTMEDFHYNDS